MRNRMAAERTLMGWMRTCVSLITFGFSICKFFHFLGMYENTSARPRFLEQPHIISLILIGLGTGTPSLRSWNTSRW